jgi:hypothetical protein
MYIPSVVNFIVIFLFVYLTTSCKCINTRISQRKYSSGCNLIGIGMDSQWQISVQEFWNISLHHWQLSSIKWVQVKLFPRVKLPKHKDGLSLPYNAQVEDAWEFKRTCMIYGCVLSTRMTSQWELMKLSAKILVDGIITSRMFARH